tara:strand:- start:3236 stop:3805 length:570 start_codon:yes stop_codon:yes gene_type:complete
MKKQIISLFIISLLFTSFKTQSTEPNWKYAQEGDKIIWIRHALAPGGGDPQGFKIEDCKTQRNLNKIGINQSKKIGQLFKNKKIKIDQVFSSQWCRCKDTAKYAFGNFKEFSALNSTFSPPFDKNEKKQIKELKNYINNWNGKGKNLVLVTHYVVILAMTGKTSSSGELIITDKDLKILSTINTFSEKN